MSRRNRDGRRGRPNQHSCAGGAPREELRGIGAVRRQVHGDGDLRHDPPLQEAGHAQGRCVCLFCCTQRQPVALSKPTEQCRMVFETQRPTKVTGVHDVGKVRSQIHGSMTRPQTVVVHDVGSARVRANTSSPRLPRAFHFLPRMYLCCSFFRKLFCGT